jgi:DNA-binding transcriptional LysR family regulator
MKSLILAGVGIGMLPKHLLAPGEGIQVLKTAYDPKSHGVKRNIYLVYPTYLKNYSRLKLIKDHLCESIAHAPELFEVA